MKYYLDTEFFEYKKKPLLGKPIDTIELISIGIVSEDDREYYAICKEFDLKSAWNNEWLRENVLIPLLNDFPYFPQIAKYWNIRELINQHGKTREEIATEIFDFINPDLGFDVSAYNNSSFRKPDSYESKHFDLYNATYDEKTNTYVAQPEFYAYYADYDWVVFCWLFGRMIDLPSGFPMYCF